LRDVDLELVTVAANDGICVEGVLYTPKFEKDKPSILLIHGSCGNFYTGIPRICSAPLAKMGYPCLALNTRYHDYFEVDMIFEEEVKDLQAGIRFFQRRSSSGVVLLGHSLGVDRVVYYMAVTNDKFVKGLVLVAGPAAISKWTKFALGKEKFKELVEFAKKKVADDPYSIIANVRRHYPQWYHPKIPDIITHRLSTVRSFLSVRAPETNADAIKHIGKIRIPILIIHGLKDEIVPPEDAKTLEEAALFSELVYVDGADHYFKGHENNLVNTIKDWLERID